MASIQKLLPTIVVIQIFVAMGMSGWLSFVSAKKEVENLISQMIVQGSNLTKYQVTEYLGVAHFFQKMNQIAIANGNLNLDNFPRIERYLWRQVQIGRNEVKGVAPLDGALVKEKGINYIFYGNTRGEFLGVERDENGKSLIRIRTQETAPERVFYELDSQGNRSREVRRQNYDPRYRPWYQAAEANKTLSWSPIYPSASDGTLAINSILPVYNQDRSLRGVLAIEINLAQVSDFLMSLKPSKNGKIFIIDRAGKLVGTSVNEPLSVSTPEGNRQIDATQSRDPMIQAAAKKLLADYQILQNPPPQEPRPIDIDGARQYIQIATLEKLDLDWLIIVLIPESDFMEKIYDNAQMTMLLGLAALGGAVVVGLITSRWIVKPIALLNQAAHEIEAEEFKPQTLVTVLKRDDELGQLARVFQEMAVKIYNREQGMKKQMDKLRLEQDRAQEASMLAVMSQKSYLQDLLKQAKKLHNKTAAYQQLNLSDLLRKVKYFQSFSEKDIQELIKIGYKKLIPEGEYVCREDEPGDAFYIILTGHVEIYVEKINKFLTNLSDGTFFGELSLLLGIPRTATVRTTTDTLLFVVDRNGLQTLLQNYQELADQIAGELHKHKAELDERQEMLKKMGLIDEGDNSFNENPLSWIRKRMTTLFGV